MFIGHSRQRSADECATAGSTFSEALRLEVWVTAVHGIGIDGYLFDHIPHGRELVTGPEYPQPNRSTDLVDDLAIGREARLPVEPKLQSRLPFHPYQCTRELVHSQGPGPAGPLLTGPKGRRVRRHALNAAREDRSYESAGPRPTFIT